MLRVGLTGGIGSGKSTVSDLLAERGALVIDADVLAREVVAPGSPGLTEVVLAFGPGIVDEHGALDRPALATRVFDDEPARRRLESIIHPRVRERARELEAAAAEDTVVVHVIPLLVETGQAESFDEVLVVDVPADLQTQRLVQTRGMSAAEVEQRRSAQATREQRLAAASQVIVNDGTPAELRAAVDQVWSRLQQR